MKNRNLFMMILLFIIVGIITIFVMKLFVNNTNNDETKTINERNITAEEKEDAEKDAFQEISDEDGDKLWNSIKIAMSDIPEVYWEFDFWDKGFYKQIPDEGKYNYCLYGLNDVNNHINEAALYLITTIPSAHNNDDVIADIEKYRTDMISEHNGMESKITVVCDNVISILSQTDEKKSWTVNNTFWVKSSNDIAGATFEGYAISEQYEVPESADYILNLDVLKDNYLEQKILGFFDFELGKIDVLSGTKEKELYVELGEDVFLQRDMSFEDASLVYWYKSEIDWVSDSVFEFSYLPYECNCNEQCRFSFKYDLKSKNASDVALVLDKCSMSRYQD